MSSSRKTLQAFAIIVTCVASFFAGIIVVALFDGRVSAFVRGSGRIVIERSERPEAYWAQLGLYAAILYVSVGLSIMTWLDARIPTDKKA